MINLFHIPNYTIDTSQFSNLLHDKIVDEFTENFCDYVGAKYGCALNSATSAIFLLSYYNNLHFNIPTMLPPVVLNAIINGENSTYSFTDNTMWIGQSYTMYKDNTLRIIDSAQEVMPRIFQSRDIIVYSFYPTKPVGGCDGGMICSNNKDIIDFFKTITINGMWFNSNSWDRPIKTTGWKMYMNSLQAYIANENLKKLGDKKHNLRILSEYYNDQFGYNHTNHHLYTIQVTNNVEFLKYMKDQGIQCGIHYKCLHKQEPYCWNRYYTSRPKSEIMEKHIVSIPFHEELSNKNTEKVVKCVHDSGMLMK